MPQVSVIIPAYNPDVTYLLETLESIWAQTFQAIEVVLVDDGSTPDVVSSLPEGQQGLKVIRQTNQGHSKARRRAVEEARGEYVAMIDADDLWASEKLEEQVLLLEANSELDFVFTDFFNFDAQGLKKPSYFTTRFSKRAEYSTLLSNGSRAWYRLSEDAIDSYLSGNYILPSTVMAKRRSWIEKDMFLSQCDCRELYEYMLRSMHELSIGFIDKPLAFRRIHASNLSHDQVKYLKNTIYISEIAQDYPWLTRENRTWLQRAANRARFSLARDYFFMSQPAKSREQLNNLLTNGHVSLKIIGLYLTTYLFPHPCLSMARSFKKKLMKRA